MILDACAALEIVLAREKAYEFALILEQAEKIFAPELFLLETANALGKQVAFGGLGFPIAQERLNDIPFLVTDWMPLIEIYQDAFHTGVQQRISIYDSCYLVIAERQQGLLLSLDKKLKTVAATLGITTMG